MMGYYTDFEIEIERWSENRDDICSNLYFEVAQKLEEITPYYWDNSLEKDGIKWYDYMDDMKKLSLEFPDVLFRVDGIGEERDDVWRKYFLNGKMQVCGRTVAFTDFDSDKLY